MGDMMTAFPYTLGPSAGRKARLGLVVLQTDETLEYEMRQLIPDHEVAIYFLLQSLDLVVKFDSHISHTFLATFLLTVLHCLSLSVMTRCYITILK